MRGIDIIFIATLIACTFCNTTASAEQIGSVTIFSSDSRLLEVNATAATKDVRIGGYPVQSNNSLSICDARGANCADDYAGAVLRINPGDTLRINLTNLLPNTAETEMDHCMVDTKAAAQSGLINLHTHGLLVSPIAGASTGTVGDNAFKCTASNAPDRPNQAIVGNKLRYELALRDISPGIRHPLGVNWMHPHIHGAAKAQVSSGMASMIVVGDINKQLCARPTSNGPPGAPEACAPTIPADSVKYLMLKDAQLVKLKDVNDASLKFINLADQRANFCGKNKFSLGNTGECQGDPDSLTDVEGFVSGKWVFTINGERAPHWEIGPDKYEVWRVQNGSANITYHLNLQSVRGAVTSKVPMTILDMDGAGLVPTTASSPLPLPQANDLLLMPGSRVDLLVQSPQEEADDVTYTLVNENFQAGFAAEDADIWPRIALATVTFKASRVQFAAFEPPAPASSRFETAVRNAPVNEARLKAALQKECIGVSPENLDSYYRNLHVAAPSKRRLYFGVFAPTNLFVLGDTIIDQDGTETDKFGKLIGPDNPVKLSTFEMHDTRSGMCVRKDGGDEIWQLVNVSNEVHNFHIHQMKFSVVREQGGSKKDEPVMRPQSLYDNVGLTKQLLFKNGLAELQHDTIIVPRGQTDCSSSLILDGTFTDGRHFLLNRGATPCDGTGSPSDTSGMIEVKLNFKGTQLAGNEGADSKGQKAKRNAKFVYHCHILEHEDNGMMAAITVIDPENYR